MTESIKLDTGLNVNFLFHITYICVKNRPGGGKKKIYQQF